MIREITFVSNEEAQKIVESDIGDINLKRQLHEVLETGEPIYRIKNKENEFEIISLSNALKKSKESLKISSEHLLEQKTTLSSVNFMFFGMISLCLIVVLWKFFFYEIDLYLIAFMTFCSLLACSFVSMYNSDHSFSKIQHSLREKTDTYIKETSKEFIEKNKEILDFYL